MKKVQKIIFSCVLLCVVFLLAGNVKKAEASIVLDPGHDASHTGANANGVAEEVVNLKIAQYCYEELQKYEGVGQVYMTRNGEGCPYPGTTSTQCNKKRVEFSKAVGAVMYVSFHNNSSSSSSAKGSTVYYPNANYRTSIGTAGERLANIVLSHLISLGLENRGTKIRNSEDNTRYPDGSLADYYGVIKNSKLSGFTGIIIEHAFVSNSSDAANYLSTDAQLKLLGIADATALAEYYGWSKKSVWDKNVSGANVSTSFSSDYRRVSVTVSGLSNAPSVSVAVWSEDNGQDDLKWYIPSKNSAGNWTFEFPISDYKKAGKYNVHAYAGDGSISLFASSATFNVEKAQASALNVRSLNTSTGAFGADITGVSAKAGIDYVKVAIWSKGDQSDLKWITASAGSGGNYSVSVNLADYGYSKGTYNIHAYAADKNGIFTMLKGATYDISYDGAVIKSSFDADELKFSVNASSFPFASYVSYAKVAVWSGENGQDDIKWYALQNNGDNWSMTNYFINHITDGVVYAHVYAYMKNGSSIFLGQTTLEPTLLSSDNLYDGIMGEDGKVMWNGNSINVVSNTGSITIEALNEASGEAAPASEGAVQVSDEEVSVSEDAVNVSSEAAQVSTDAVQISSDAVQISSEAAQVSTDAAQASGDAVYSGDAAQTSQTHLISENLLMREKVYTIKNNTDYYKKLKAIFDSKTDEIYRTFVIRGVGLEAKSDNYKYNLNGKVNISFKLPEEFINKNVAIYEVIRDNNSVSLGNKYKVYTDDNGYAVIEADRLGDFVIASDKVDFISGDIDFDGKVSLADVVILLKGALGVQKFTERQQVVADVDLDGKITLSDAKQALLIAIGIIK